MQSVLKEVIARLEAKDIPNEQAIKQTLVLPVLHSLGWDVWDSKTVWPEFSVSGGFVDFALCSPSKHPQIFIEVKQPSTFNAGEDQLMMSYAFQHGITVAVLTDGQRWSFYLPGGNGTFEERRFYLLDFSERDLKEIEFRLRRYLSFAEVKSGNAFDLAKDDHKDAARLKAIKGALPAAWKELIEDADPQLVAVVLAKVESSTGYKPTEMEVAEFLHLQASVPTIPKSTPTKKTIKPPKVQPAPIVKPQTKTPTGTGKGESWYSVNGVEKLRNENAAQVTREALRELANLNPQFLEKFEKEMLSWMAQKRQKNVKSRWIARTKEELYTNLDRRKQSVELVPGWWLGENYGNPEKGKMLSMARKVALNMGIQFDFHVANARFEEF